MQLIIYDKLHGFDTKKKKKKQKKNIHRAWEELIQTLMNNSGIREISSYLRPNLLQRPITLALNNKHRFFFLLGHKIAPLPPPPPFGGGVKIGTVGKILRN